MNKRPRKYLRPEPDKLFDDRYEREYEILNDEEKELTFLKPKWQKNHEQSYRNFNIRIRDYEEG